MRSRPNGPTPPKPSRIIRTDNAARLQGNPENRSTLAIKHIYLINNGARALAKAQGEEQFNTRHVDQHLCIFGQIVEYLICSDASKV